MHYFPQHVSLTSVNLLDFPHVLLALSMSILPLNVCVVCVLCNQQKWHHTNSRVKHFGKISKCSRVPLLHTASSFYTFMLLSNVNSVVIVIVVVSSCAVGLKQLRLLLLLLLQLCLLCCLLYSLPLLLLKLLLLQSGLKQQPVVRAEQFTNLKITEAFHRKKIDKFNFVLKILSIFPLTHQSSLASYKGSHSALSFGSFLCKLRQK